MRALMSEATARSARCGSAAVWSGPVTHLEDASDRRETVRQMSHLVACLANTRSHTPIVIAAATACLMELRGSSHE